MRHDLRRKYKTRRKAEPAVAISIRVPLDVEAQLRRLLQTYECSVPTLFALSLDALDAASQAEATAE